MRDAEQVTAIRALLHMVLKQEAYKAYGTIGGYSRVTRLISEAFDRFQYLHDALEEQDLRWADDIWGGIFEILERALKRDYPVELETIKTISRM